MSNDLFPLTVYGLDVSYFSGKLEMYLRARGIAHRLQTFVAKDHETLMKNEIGCVQIPAVQLADGRWMTDTTPMIAWLEEHVAAAPLLPADPVQRFFCLLLEDYADEWLWRPAMHFRWYTDEGAMHASRHITDAIMQGIPAPGPLKRWFFRRRQRGYTQGDGVDESNRAAVEAIYTDNLTWLSDILATQPFLLGNAPSLADIAFMGPMFRHFSNDPVPAEIMRTQAPRVWEWIARLWNSQPNALTGDWLQGIPENWNPLLDDIGRNYLPYLCANAEQVLAGEKRLTTTINGINYRNARLSPYRVWCLKQLQDHYRALPETAAAVVRQRLEQHQCWEPLWRITDPATKVNQGLTPPFGSNVKML
jgi:glutathione S-transferase